MGFEGRKINDNVVMFGEPLNEKALKALQKQSPTADSILSSLPKEAFIPLKEKYNEEEENKKALLERENERIEKEKVLKNLSKSRRAAKKAAAKRKEIIAKKKKDFNIKTINLIERELNMDLEKELAALSEQVEERNERAPLSSVQYEGGVETAQEENMRDQLLNILANVEDAPSVAEINAWKDSYGKNGIHVMAFGEDEAYVYHHLTRKEWRQIKTLMAKLKETTDDGEEIEEQLKEKVVLYCVLFPKLDSKWLEYCKAGAIDSLYQMILLNSGFLTPQQSMLLTTQL